MINYLEIKRVRDKTLFNFTRKVSPSTVCNGGKNMLNRYYIGSALNISYFHQKKTIVTS